MEEIAEDLSLNYLTDRFRLPNFETYIEASHNMDENQIDKFIQLIDDNLGDLYVEIDQLTVVLISGLDIFVSNGFQISIIQIHHQRLHII